MLLFVPPQKIPTLQSSARCRTASPWTTVSTEPPASCVLQCRPLPWEVDCIGLLFLMCFQICPFFFFPFLNSPFFLHHAPLCSGDVLNEPTPGHSSGTNTRLHHCILQHFHRLSILCQSSRVWSVLPPSRVAALDRSANVQQGCARGAVLLRQRSTAFYSCLFHTMVTLVVFGN